MDFLSQYVMDQVTEYITQAQEREPDEGEVERVADAVHRLAFDFIATQISNALS